MFPVVCSISEKYRLSEKEEAVLHHLLFYRDNHIMKERITEDFSLLLVGNHLSIFLKSIWNFSAMGTIKD